MNINGYDDEVISLNNEMLTSRSSMSGSYIAISTRFVRKAKELDDANLLGYAYYYLADAYYLLSTNYRKFNMSLIKAIEYLQSVGDNEHLSRCYNLLGIDALNHGNQELALDFFLKGLNLCEDLEESGVQGFIEFNMSHIYYKFGNVKKALASIRSAYKYIRKNRKESFYFRNILYCYCFEADCYMDLGKPDSVRRCLDAIERIKTYKGCNQEIFSSIAVLDVRMRAFHYLNQPEEFEECFETYMNLIKNGSYSMDNVEDIYKTIRFFNKAGKRDEALFMVDCIEKSVQDLNISNLKLEYARLRCELYDKDSDKENKLKALEDFYKYTQEFEKERLINYRFFTDMRTRLSDKENLALLKQAETDPLTGLGNRYGLNKYADQAFENASANRTSLAVEILDVDDFKKYNDIYGHQSGDACLRHIGDTIAALCRENSAIHAYRYGGDEFVIIYENMTDEEVLEHAKRLRREISGMQITSKRNNQARVISISQGIRNSVPQEMTKLWDYMYAADNALYDVKESKKGEIALIHKAVIDKASLDEATFAGSN